MSRRQRAQNASPAVAASAAVSLSETQIASMIAGLVTRLVLHPADTLKTRLQHARGRRSAGTASALISLLRAEKIPGLYRGIGGALVGVLPCMLSWTSLSANSCFVSSVSHSSLLTFPSLVND
jgi:Mitochondrial carrier protein